MSDASAMITTIIPTFRRPHFLRRALRSVLNQTYTHIRVCVYDNASGDETAAVVAEMARGDSRLQYYCQPENMGVNKNFLYGMVRVETPFFSFLADDDVLLPEFYEKAMRAFELYPEAMCSFNGTLHVYDRGRTLGSLPSPQWKPGLHRPPDGLLNMLQLSEFNWQGALFRRDVLDSVGLLDLQVGACIDIDFELRLAASQPFAVSLEPVAICIGHGESYSQSLPLDATWPGCLAITHKLVQMESLPAEARAFAEKVLTARWQSVLFGYFGVRAIMGRRWDQVERAAAILRTTFHQAFRASLLLGLGRICRYFPPAYYLALGYYKLRRLRARLASRPLREKWGPYLKLLEEP